MQGDAVRIQRRLFAAQPLHRQADGFVLMMRFAGGTAIKGHVAPDHQADQLFDVGLRHRAGAGEAAVLENGEAVAELENLVQAVGDIDNAHATVFKLAHHAVQAFHLAVAQRGGGFVHNDEPGVEGQRPGDLHHLLLGHAQAGDRGGRRNVQLQIVENDLRLLIDRLFVDDQITFTRLAPEKHVFRDGHVGQQVEFLIDGDNALVLPFHRGVVHRQRFAVEPDLPAGLRLRPRERLQQRGFTRPVFPQQSVDLARADGQLGAA